MGLFARRAKTECDTLTLDYEKFIEDGLTVMTVRRGKQILAMFRDSEAEDLYNKLKSDE